MKAKYVKLISALVCIAAIFTVIALTKTELHGASSDTVLFYNDRAWTISSRLPAEQVHTVYYVPISYIVQLPNVDVRMNESLGTFVITHGELFLSFDTTTDFAMNQDKERTYLKTAEYHNERYVPIRTVCAYLELGYEQITNSVTGVTAIRITDGNEQADLADLIKTRYPSLFPDEPETSTPSSDTTNGGQAPDTSEPTPTLSQRTVYITVEGCTGKYTSAILSVLKRYGYEATFFVSEEEIGNDAALLSKICAGGHGLALSLTAESGTDKGSVLSEISRQNEWLSRLIKKKTHVWSFAASTTVAASASSELYTQLFESGYVMWNSTQDVSTAQGSQAAANAAIDAIWKNETVTLRFKEASNTAEAMRLVLDFIKRNGAVCDVRTAYPAFAD